MKPVLLASALTAFLSSTAIAAHDKPDGLPPTIAALVESIGAVTKSSGAVMDTRLTTVRVYKIRQQLTDYLLSGDLNKIPNFPKDDALLCEPRKKQVILLSSITYLNTVTAQVKATAKSDITADTDTNNIIRAFKSLFADYRIDVDAPDTGIENKVEARCQDDLKKFAATYYGVAPANEAAIVAAFAALSRSSSRSSRRSSSKDPDSSTKPGGLKR